MQNVNTLTDQFFITEIRDLAALRRNAVVECVRNARGDLDWVCVTNPLGARNCVNISCDTRRRNFLSLCDCERD